MMRNFVKARRSLGLIKSNIWHVHWLALVGINHYVKTNKVTCTTRMRSLISFRLAHNHAILYEMLCPGSYFYRNNINYMSIRLDGAGKLCNCVH